MTTPSPADDPVATSWVPDSTESGFPIQNLAFGACRVGSQWFLGVRIGASALDLRAVVDADGFDGLAPVVRDALRADDLGPLLGLGRPAWTAVRQALGTLLVAGSDAEDALSHHLVPVDEVELELPFPVADFVDFYSSIDHASNIGRMFRPDAEPLLPNWRHLPVGYHGRAGTVVVSGTPVVRPSGQRLEDGAVVFGPSTKLDIELEVGFVLGGTSRPGHPVDITEVREHVFGVVLLNDWSARDIQSWEYVPLGPFLGKSFATSISGWVVPIDALDPFRVPGPDQDPPVLPYLERLEPWGLDLTLSVDLRPAGSTVPVTSPRSMRGTPGRDAYPRRTTSSPSARKLRWPPSTATGSAPFQLASINEPRWPTAGPETVPDPKRSPGRTVAPLTVRWASCWSGVQ